MPRNKKTMSINVCFTVWHCAPRRRVYRFILPALSGTHFALLKKFDGDFIGNLGDDLTEYVYAGKEAELLGFEKLFYAAKMIGTKDALTRYTSKEDLANYGRQTVKMIRVKPGEKITRYRVTHSIFFGVLCDY